MKVIDDEMLQRFARALNVPFDYLKTLEEDAQTVVFENNTVNDSEQNTGGERNHLLLVQRGCTRASRLGTEISRFGGALS